MQAEDGCTYQLDLLTDDLPAELADLVTFAAAQAPSYIWHHDAFNLHIDGSSLRGKTRVGDCIDDEWFIVWLLREMTRRKEGAVASITDADGHFLLIEAAEHLPKWVAPDTADNRVYIHDGRLHLVPLYCKSPPSANGEGAGANEGSIDPRDALRFVRDETIDTLAPAAVEQAAWARIASYPGCIAAAHLHRARAYLPADVASALRADPQLVSQATRAFYERDALQLKACQSMKRFPPAAAGARDVSILLTRPLYAQLVAQHRFYPPKPFEKAGWYDDVGPKSPDYRHRDVGMKLTCGFEMLYQETSASLRTTRITGRTEPDPAYDRFLARLTELGYFRGELVGSKLYSELEEAARSRYGTRPASTSFAASVETAIKRAQDTPESQSLQEDEDDDSWLDLDPQGLEDMLRAKGNVPDFGDDEEAAAQAEAKKLDGFAEQLGRFVDGEGSLEGAMFDDEMSDDDDDETDASGNEMELTGEERAERLATLVPALPENEWGAKDTKDDAPPPPLEDSHPVGTESKLVGLEKSEHFEGVSDDEDDEPFEEEEEDETTSPAVADVDIDLAGEMDDFLRFTRETLGLSDSQYADIIEARKDRGAFVPSNETLKSKAGTVAETPLAMRPSVLALQKQAHAARNPNLNSFEALMNAMDSELQKAKPSNDPYRATASSGDSSPIDEQSSALDAEFDEVLQRNDSEAPVDYTLIKNFLESYRSQQGAGPVSNLAGRLGVPLSRASDGDR